MISPAMQQLRLALGLAMVGIASAGTCGFWCNSGFIGNQCTSYTDCGTCGTGNDLCACDGASEAPNTCVGSNLEDAGTAIGVILLAILAITIFAYVLPPIVTYFCIIKKKKTEVRSPLLHLARTDAAPTDGAPSIPPLFRERAPPVSNA
eukprot:SAG31_NODE_5618_length_2421_cov_15.170112_1_plen_149_part_00